MRTSGAGKGGILVAVAGVVAMGVAGCASNSGGTKTDSAAKAAAGVDTSATSTADAPSTPAPTSAATSDPVSDASSSSSSSAPSVDPSTPASKTTTTPPAKTTTPSKPKTTTPAKTGSGWLAGVPLGHNTPGTPDPRCMTGRVICVDMSHRTLVWMVNGKAQYGMDVRFGDENNPTRKGKFDIYMKMKDCVSTIYHTPMPDAMFFSGGEAVHFSIDFATYGYAHHSHGCVNVRDRAAVERLFADTRVGDTVVVY